MTNIVASALTWKQTGLFREYVSCDNYTGSVALRVLYFIQDLCYEHKTSTWYDLRLTAVRIQSVTNMNTGVSGTSFSTSI